MPARATRRSVKNQALRTTARKALAKAEEVASTTTRSFINALCDSPDSDIRFAGRLRTRVDLAAHALRQTLADAVIAAYVSDEVLSASVQSKSVELHLVRVPSVISHRILVFRVKPVRGFGRKVTEQVVYTEADLDGTQASMNIPDFGTVTISLPTRDDDTVDDHASVVVTTWPHPD